VSGSQVLKNYHAMDSVKIIIQSLLASVEDFKQPQQNISLDVVFDPADQLIPFWLFILPNSAKN
jgi:uncharacterized membrane protein